MRTVAAKFGGTSLAGAEQFRKVAQIIRQDPARRYIVASAPGKRSKDDIKVTDLLYECYDAAVNGRDTQSPLRRVEERFRGIVDDLGISFDVEGEIDVIRAMLRTYPQRDYMASRGEYLNSRILAAYLGYDFVDPAGCIRFDDAGRLMEKETKELLSKCLKPLDRAVIAGFYGARENGCVQTFSRGGSDITGSLVAEAVYADVYENWTDVSGMLAADPRIVPGAKSIDYISYRELRTLSYMGASVLHTDAVLPAKRSGIPIHILNTNCPADKGTVIATSLPEDRVSRAVTGVAGRKGLSVVQVEKSMVSDGAGFTAILLDVFKEYRVPFEQCLTGIDTVSVVIRSDLFQPKRDVILNRIREALDPDVLRVEEDLAMIAVVGERVKNDRCVTIRILDAIAKMGIEASTINQGSGGLNLIVGVAEKDYENAVRAIYGEIE